jgi:Domain of unknown function (DUF4062)
MFGVFLSSTFQDFNDYRDEVSAALEEDADVRATLLENVAGPYVDTVELCRQALHNSDAYLLLLAHWYGSIPPPGSKSITHREYEWACDRWKNRANCPIAVLMPQAGSPADLDLKEKAAALLSTADDRYRSDHPRLIAEFQRQVTGNWRRVMYFPTKERAARKALVAYSYWRGENPLRAAAAGPQFEGINTDLLSSASLGSLGRREQMDALQRELARIKIRPNVPGAVFLVSGHELAGQRHFLDYVSRAGVFPGRPAAPTLLPSQQFPSVKLPGWASDQLGFSGADRAEAIPDLAAHIALELKKQALTFFLADVGVLAGRGESFVRDFWSPLYRALAELRQQQSFKYRLFSIVADYEATPELWQNSVSPADPAEYEKLVPLPRLGDITADALAQWLEQKAVAEEQRPAILREVLKGKATENPGIVFERLNRQSFLLEENVD